MAHSIWSALVGPRACGAGFGWAVDRLVVDGLSIRTDRLSYPAQPFIIETMNGGQDQSDLHEWLFHPIRSFCGDLAANPLSRFLWGIEPENRTRRRRSLVAVWFPSCLYLALLLTFLFGAAPPFGGASIRNARNFDAVVNLMISASFFAAILWAPLMVLIRVFNMTPARRLEANWTDYHLAGISGHQMLWAMAGPGLIGLTIATLIFGLTFGPSSMLLVVNEVFLEPADPDIWFIFVFGLAPVFAILIGTLLDIALWVILPSFLLRLMVVGLLSVVTSPVLAYFFVAMTGFTPTNASPFVMALIEGVSWPFRVWFAVRMLRRALRRLEIK